MVEHTLCIMYFHFGQQSASSSHSLYHLQAVAKYCKHLVFRKKHMFTPAQAFSDTLIPSLSLSHTYGLSLSLIYLPTYIQCFNLQHIHPHIFSLSLCHTHTVSLSLCLSPAYPTYSVSVSHAPTYPPIYILSLPQSHTYSLSLSLIYLSYIQCFNLLHTYTSTHIHISLSHTYSLSLSLSLSLTHPSTHTVSLPLLHTHIH